MTKGESECHPALPKSGFRCAPFHSPMDLFFPAYRIADSCGGGCILQLVPPCRYPCPKGFRRPHGMRRPVSSWRSQEVTTNPHSLLSMFVQCSRNPTSTRWGVNDEVFESIIGLAIALLASASYLQAQELPGTGSGCDQLCGTVYQNGVPIGHSCVGGGDRSRTNCQATVTECTTDPCGGFAVLNSSGVVLAVGTCGTCQ